WLHDLSILDLLLGLGSRRRRSLRLGFDARPGDGDASGYIDEVERLIRVVDAHRHVGIDGASESGGRAGAQHRGRVRLPVLTPSQAGLGRLLDSPRDPGGFRFPLALRLVSGALVGALDEPKILA